MHRPRLLASALAAACILAVPAAPAVAAVPNSWTPTVTPSADRYAAAAALLPGHRVLVAGGFDAAGNGLRSAEVYDPAANNWSRAADMGAARAAATATALADGRVLVTGGVPDSTGVATAQNTGEVYDPATNAWTPVLNPMSVKRLEH